MKFIINFHIKSQNRTTLWKGHLLLAAQKISMAELKINTLVNSVSEKKKVIESIKRSDPEEESSGIPLRIKSALKADKINFFDKLEKCSKMAKLKAKMSTKLRTNQVGIFGNLETHHIHRDLSTPKKLKPENFNWPPKNDQSHQYF